MIQFVGTDSVRNLNRSLLLKEILQKGPTTKIDLADKFKLTFQAVGNIVKELSEAELIEEVGYGKSRGGRPPILYNIQWDSVYVISLVIEVEKVIVGLVDLKGQVTDERVVTFPVHEFMENVIELIDTILKETKVEKKRIAGIGVSAPGPLDVTDGKVLTPPNLQEISNVDIQRLLEERYQLPTVLERDANAFALAEQWFGNAKRDENILYVFNDQGLGGGLIINSRIHRGIGNSAGEIGHMVIDIDGPRCNCGNFGCLEALSSGIAIQKRILEEIRRGHESSLSAYYLTENKKPSLDLIVSHAKSGDKLAIDVLHEAERYLGFGIANVMNLFSPDKIIFGGSVINLYPEMITTTEEIAKQRAFSPVSQKIEFIKTAFGDYSNTIGAAAVIQQMLFDNPDTIIKKQTNVI